MPDNKVISDEECSIEKVEFHTTSEASRGNLRSRAMRGALRLQRSFGCACSRLWASGVAYCLAAGAGGTGRMISEATFQSFPTFIQFMIIRNGLGVPSCPA